MIYYIVMHIVRWDDIALNGVPVSSYPQDNVQVPGVGVLPVFASRDAAPTLKLARGEGE